MKWEDIEKETAAISATKTDEEWRRLAEERWDELDEILGEEEELKKHQQVKQLVYM